MATADNGDSPNQELGIVDAALKKYFYLKPRQIRIYLGVVSI